MGRGTAGLLDFKDEDNMSSNSETAVASQQSIKAYTDTAVSAISFIKAHVCFDGTGSTSANQTKLSSSNVTSVYKNADGDYTVTMTSAIADTNYSIIGTAANVSGVNAVIVSVDYNTAPTTTVFRIVTKSDSGGATNSARVSILVVR